SEKHDRLLQTLLRRYTGLFADYVLIQEDWLAHCSGLTQQEVYEGLIYLSKTHVIHYIPRKKTPYIIYTSRRVESRYVMIPRKVYEERKARYEHRINSMLAYTLGDDECRVKTLLGYFREKIGDCGHCDVCMERSGRKKLTTEKFSLIEQDIRDWLTVEPSDLMTIVEHMPYAQELVVGTLRFLCDENYIVCDNGLYKINK
ncbi:MAG: RecQ family zinc-binding domain-containing protein, partial [Coprobacter sp.]|nr:RecQ family zinc-binding domain-containing protein [Coprobacter sp.]